jgi:hypothetical protein
MVNWQLKDATKKGSINQARLGRTWPNKETEQSLNCEVIREDASSERKRERERERESGRERRKEEGDVLDLDERD